MNIYFLQGNDAFTVDVSNGFTTVEDLQIDVNIVPRIIPIQTSNFTVKEGLSRAINTEIVNISHPFYSSENIDFVVEEPPQHGDIRYLDGDDLTYFTWEEVCNAKLEDMHTFDKYLHIPNLISSQALNNIISLLSHSTNTAFFHYYTTIGLNIFL